MRVKYNDHIENLYCVECKERIEIGNKFIESREYYLNERILKHYHIDCCPPDEDEINESFDKVNERNSFEDIDDFESDDNND